MVPSLVSFDGFVDGKFMFLGEVLFSAPMCDGPMVQCMNFPKTLTVDSMHF